jgi:hypothetical protein
MSVADYALSELPFLAEVIQADYGSESAHTSIGMSWIKVWRAPLVNGLLLSHSR